MQIALLLTTSVGSSLVKEQRSSPKRLDWRSQAAVHANSSRKRGDTTRFGRQPNLVMRPTMRIFPTRVP
jgi:hypothetical protein